VWWTTPSAAYSCRSDRRHADGEQSVNSDRGCDAWRGQFCDAATHRALDLGRPSAECVFDELGADWCVLDVFANLVKGALCGALSLQRRERTYGPVPGGQERSSSSALDETYEAVVSDMERKCPCLSGHENLFGRSPETPRFDCCGGGRQADITTANVCTMAAASLRTFSAARFRRHQCSGGFCGTPRQDEPPRLQSVPETRKGKPRGLQ